MTILSVVLAGFLVFAIYIIVVLNSQCEKLENKLEELHDMIEDKKFEELHKKVYDDFDF